MTFASRMSRVTVSPTLKVSANVLRRWSTFSIWAPASRFPTPEHVSGRACPPSIELHEYTPSAASHSARVALMYPRITVSSPRKLSSAAGAKQRSTLGDCLYEPGDDVITHGPFCRSSFDDIKLADPSRCRADALEAGFAISRVVHRAMTPRTNAIVINRRQPTGALMSEDKGRARVCGAAAPLIVLAFTYEMIYDPSSQPVEILSIGCAKRGLHAPPSIRL